MLLVFGHFILEETRTRRKNLKKKDSTRGQCRTVSLIINWTLSSALVEKTANRLPSFIDTVIKQFILSQYQEKNEARQHESRIDYHSKSTESFEYC